METNKCVYKRWQSALSSFRALERVSCILNSARIFHRNPMLVPFFTLGKTEGEQEQKFV